MPLTIAIKHDADKAVEKLRDQLTRRAPRAAAAGLNRTAQAAQTAAVRAIQKDLGASAQKTIRRNLSIQRATPQKLEASLIARSAKTDRIPIYELRPRPSTVTKHRPAGGVRYGPQGKQIPGSFIARLKSGHVGVFARQAQTRLPITELKGPSIALVLSRPRVHGQVQKVIAEKLPKEMHSAFRFAR